MFSSKFNKNTILVFILFLVYGKAFAQNSPINDSVYIKVNDSITRAYKPTGAIYYLNDKLVPQSLIAKMAFEGKGKEMSGYAYPDPLMAIKMLGEKYRHGIYFTYFDGGVNNEQPYFYLAGIIDKKFNNKNIMLFTFKNGAIESVDTTMIRDGNFHFQGEEYKDDFSLLSVGNWPNDEVWSLEVLLEKGNIKVNISNKKENGRIGGTPLNDLYQSYSDSVKAYFSEISKLHETQGYEGIKKNSPLENKYKEYGQFSINFKQENISNIVGQKLFHDEVRQNHGEIIAYGDYNAFQIVLDAASEEYKIKNKDWIEQIHEAFLKTEEKNIEKNNLLGKPYIDFEFKTPEDEYKKFSDYVGKSDFLLIDFWSSWCAPCIAEFPFLKKTYDKYKNKGLEIISVSLDDKKSVWQKALSRVDAPWIHFCDFKGSRSGMTEAYGIHGIPFLLLLDKNGTIININLKGSRLESALEQLIN